MQTLYNRLHKMLAISKDILVGTVAFLLHLNLFFSIQMITLEPWEIISYFIYKMGISGDKVIFPVLKNFLWKYSGLIKQCF